jgi:hypothetical protein
MNANETTRHADTIATFERIWMNDRTPIQAGGVIALGDTLPSATTYGVIECDDWDGADYRLCLSLTEVAINVTFTGRPRYWHAGESTWRRCRIEFVGNC